MTLDQGHRTPEPQVNQKQKQKQRQPKITSLDSTQVSQSETFRHKKHVCKYRFSNKNIQPSLQDVRYATGGSSCFFQLLLLLYSGVDGFN
ncbi:hypothetical protein KQX54_007986 [Cotesia glomerata]|uniref:Uncharacterized protein n=1 Tax=Cotesia glomerata TaxID=32391 RepID=A0AAV7I4R1_COTGL|nr:hypothetical protein KQX54_007986 [Cotesia glomerata]